MADNVKAGCTLTIEFKEPIQFKYMMKWLTTNSGVSKDYIGKILATKMYGNRLSLKFDSSANCFEVMQQVTVLGYTVMNPTTRQCKNRCGGGSSYKVVNNKCTYCGVIQCVDESLSTGITHIWCPCGMFFKITTVPDFDNVEMGPIAEQLQKHGVIVRSKRVKDEYGVCTGGFELIMFAKGDSKLLNREWLFANENKFKVEEYFATKAERVPIEKVSGLWNKYGLFADKPDVGNLVISGKGDVDDKIIEQVD